MRKNTDKRGRRRREKRGVEKEEEKEGEGTRKAREGRRNGI